MEEDRSLLQKEMGAQQQQFERNLEELAYRVANFHQYDDISRVAKVHTRRSPLTPPPRLSLLPHSFIPTQPLPLPLQVTAMVADIQQALKDYEAKAQIFNTREALFGEPATEYEQLAKLVKDFEPYASLWTTAADWQKWQREWLDGPLLDLQPDDVEKSFVGAQRGVAKLIKSFKDTPGCLNIAKALKGEMAGFSGNVPVVQALRNPGMRDRHWDALSAELRFELRPDEKFTLRDATEGLRLHEAAPLEKVQKVCSRAILRAIRRNSAQFF